MLKARINLGKWLLIFLAAQVLMTCKKESASPNAREPSVQKLQLSAQNYQINATFFARDFKQMEYTLSDAFGHQISGSSFNDSVISQGFNLNFDAKKEGFYEGQLQITVRLENNDVTKVFTQLGQLNVPTSARQNMLYFSPSGAAMRAFFKDNATQVERLEPALPNPPIFVSGSYNPLMLFYSNGRFIHRRLSDSVYQELSFSAMPLGDFLPSIERVHRVFVPTSAGEILIFSPDLSGIRLISPSFTGRLQQLLVLQDYTVLIYNNLDGQTFYEIRDAQADLIVQAAQPMSFVSVFVKERNTLIFVEASEGSFYNYKSLDVDRLSFDIVGNSAAYQAENEAAIRKGSLAFFGTYKNQRAFYELSTPGYEPIPRLVIGDNDVYSLKSASNPYNSAILAFNQASEWRFLASEIPQRVNVSLRLNQNEVDIDAPIFIFPE